GAQSLSNSLSAYFGNSTDPAVQGALNIGGLNFTSLDGYDGISDRTVSLDATGATFGTMYVGDNGRNYIRTNDSDYANETFTAEVTVVGSSFTQDFFFGMGAGELGSFGVPDWQSPWASVQLDSQHIFNAVPTDRNLDVFYTNDFVDNGFVASTVAP